MTFSTAISCIGLLSIFTLVSQTPLSALAEAQTQTLTQIPATGTLTVEVSGIKNTEGQMCVSLFSSSVGFPNEDTSVIAQQCLPLELAGESEDSSSISVVFEGLEASTYAVSALHDENEDQQVNQGAFGIPTEGFGFSRNPAVRTRAPEFQEAAIVIIGNTDTQIDMIYF